MTRTEAYAIRRKDAFKELRGFLPLAPFAVHPPGEWRISKLWVYPEQCYRRAWCFLIDNYGKELRDDSTVRLIHGLYGDPGIGNTGHAWVEIDSDTVFDGVMQSFYSLRDYARFYHTVLQARYTLQEAIQVGLRHENYGPWHNADNSGCAPLGRSTTPRKAAGRRPSRPRGQSLQLPN